MVKNVKLSSANVRWHLRTLSVGKAKNINSNPRTSSYYTTLENILVLFQFYKVRAST